MSTTATTAQVRLHYKNQGYEVKINKVGHVMFRRDGGPWLDGRWVQEYRVTGGIVRLS